MEYYDAHQLRLQGRAITPPFRLRVIASGKTQEVTCRQILRHVPGKRLVFRGTWDRRQVVAKLYLDTTAAGRHFRRELKGIKALAAAGLPTPPLVFQGSLEDARTPLLMIAAIEDALDLGRHFKTLGCPTEGRALLRQAVTAIAQMHDAGLRQRDIHPGNFLYSDGGIMIIDGDAVEKADAVPLPTRPSLANLTLFLAQFEMPFDTLLPELAATYAHARRRPMGPISDAAIAAAVWRWREWRQRKYLRKIQRPCSEVAVTRRLNRYVAQDRTWEVPGRTYLLDDPDRSMASGTLLKAGHSATVAKVALGSASVVIKRYNIKNACHALGRGLRTSRAMRSWKNAHRLKLLGIPTPRPLAVIEERWGFVRRRAFFVMAFLPGETIDQALRSRLVDEPSGTAVLDRLERLLAQLAAARISHGDFKASNFIWSAGTLYLLDLDGMRVHRRRSAFHRAFRRDLLRLQRNWRDVPTLRGPIAAMADRLLRALDENDCVGIPTDKG